MHKNKGKDDTIKDYFNYTDYYNFVSNNTNNEHWFRDKNIIHNYFTKAVQELVQVKLEDK